MPRKINSSSLGDYKRTRRWELLRRIKDNHTSEHFPRHDQLHLESTANDDHLMESTLITGEHETSFESENSSADGRYQPSPDDIGIMHVDHHSSEHENEFSSRNLNHTDNNINVNVASTTSSNIDEFNNDDNQSSTTDTSDNEESSDGSSDETSSEDDEDDMNSFEYDQPLYEGTPLTLAESLLSIFTFFITSNMTWLHFDKLLSLMTLHFPASSTFKKTRHLFMKYFNHGEIPMVKHWYCSECMMYCSDEHTPCNCSNNPKRWYFIEMSIVDQLQRLLLKPGFPQDLRNHNRPPRKQHRNNIEDIHDGLEYKNHIQNNNPHLNSYHLSFMWYTDGAPVFKSRKYSIWPLYLTINELPYKNRIEKDNMIIAGIWFGPTDPVVNMYLKPLYNQMVLLTRGVNLKVFGRREVITVKGTLLCGTADTLARADFSNHIRFNGHYGCMRCLAPGHNIREENNFGNTHIYPYEGGDPILLTKEQYEEHAESAMEDGIPSYGVKSLSILHKMMPNMIRGTAIDIMHCVYLGVVKRLYEIWFNSSNNSSAFSLRQFRDVLDTRIKEIKPPSFVKRMPRSLSMHLSYFKASKLKTLFLYYSIPILYDLLESSYFEHYIQLVYGIYILNSDSISPQSLEYSRKLLTAFVSKFQALYGPQFMSFNIHSLLHLPDVVEDLGPLWVTSCFPYEDSLGKMVNIVHGTRYVGMQIYSKITHNWSIKNKLSNLNEDSTVKKYCKDLLTVGYRVKNNIHQIAEETYVIGKMKHIERMPINLERALERIGVNNASERNICIFKKLNRYRQIIHATNDTNKTESSCVMIQAENDYQIGFIEVFVKICYCNDRSCQENCGMSSFYALFKKLEVHLPFDVSLKTNIKHHESDYVDDRIVVPYIYKVINEGTSFDLVNIESILTLCFLVKTGNSMYVLKPSNKYEYDQ